MGRQYRAKLLRIHISESDRYDGKPLYEAIVAKCRQMRIAGATVLCGIEGYGEKAEIHRDRLVRADRPVVILIVDLEANLAALLPEIEAMMDTGLMAISDVDVIRVEKRAAHRQEGKS